MHYNALQRQHTLYGQMFVDNQVFVSCSVTTKWPKPVPAWQSICAQTEHHEVMICQGWRVEEDECLASVTLFG